MQGQIEPQPSLPYACSRREKSSTRATFAVPSIVSNPSTTHSLPTLFTPLIGYETASAATAARP